MARKPMTFEEFWNKACGNNKISYWFTENHQDCGTLPASMYMKNINEVPKRVRKAFIVRIGAEGKDLLDVGLAENFEA